MSNIAERIKARREQLGMTQQSLGEMIGKNQKQIWQYETASVIPGSEVVALLAHALETTADWILGLTEIPERPMRGAGDLDDLEKEALKVLRTKTEEQRQRIVEIIKLVG